MESTQTATTRKRRTRIKEANLRALARFAESMETAGPQTRKAAIVWLADKYLGVKVRNWI